MIYATDTLGVCLLLCEVSQKSIRGISRYLGISTKRCELCMNLRLELIQTNLLFFGCFRKVLSHTHLACVAGVWKGREGKGSFGKGSFKFERNATDVVSRPNSLPLPFPTPATQATTHFVNDLYTLYNRLNAISRFRKKHENMWISQTQCWTLFVISKATFTKTAIKENRW